MEAIIWMAALGVLAIFAMVPMTVHLLKEVLVADGEEIDTGRVERREAPRGQGGTGS